MKLLVWLIPLFPALGALINGLLGRRFTRERAHLIAVGSVGISLLLALIVIIRTIFNPSEPIHAKLYTWVFAGEFSADMALLVDPLSLQYLMGAEVDYSENLQGAQFVIRNPNASTTCGCGSSFSM